MVMPLSEVFSVKIKRELKEKMDKYKGRVDWAAEVRRFLEEKVRLLEAEENIGRVVERISKIPFEAPRGSSVASIREDRDSR